MIRASAAPAATACEFVVELIVAGRHALRTHPVLATLSLAECGDSLFGDEMMAHATPVVGELLRPLLERELPAGGQFDDVVECVPGDGSRRDQSAGARAAVPAVMMRRRRSSRSAAVR